MIIKANDVIGLPVYTVKEGKRLDLSVKDVVFDPQTNKVEALVLDEGGWFSDTKVILLPNLQSIGSDAVLISEEGKITEAGKVKPKVASIVKGDNYLTNDKVITEDGIELGRISDILFNTENGKVEEFEVTQGALKNVGTGKKTFKAGDIKTVGQDAIIVKARTQAQFEKQAEQKGVSGQIHEAQKHAPSIIDTAKQKTQELTGRTRMNKDQSDEMADRMREAAEQAKGAVKQKMDEAEKNRRNDAVGKYVTRNILSQNDKILARRGNMVTHKLLNEAEKNDVLEQVIANTSVEPLEMKGMTSDGEPEVESMVIESVRQTNPQQESMHSMLGEKTEQKTRNPKKSSAKKKK